MATSRFDIAQVPFVPGFDLLEKRESPSAENGVLTEREACAVGLALHQLLPPLQDPYSNGSGWKIASKFGALAQKGTAL